ncbi:Gfo/Idh/MocA family oxidoreductase [Dorea acetigenes]|jgi:predicted dehydrogenase|uniref:Gfo/Idh/MocA family oxidoreductase n=1 Tax=Dorea acetigenes TaxID=2981787 RepID=A0ABT2RIG4_9FIRM|nr:Gfo/Idh/MocA family oxidoreductase [Dorea acetigenes]MCB6414381.1 Gfo/Idh/MocA family oxidoreductase [Faecalimonas umbilicata]MCU6685168.1 Gfo/Idh/MocA family oxidoreductase [Dorea acetigenes]SCI39105.1 1%2C5-anhydro-D-fructose reductase [uncultured Clostridium sp.]
MNVGILGAGRIAVAMAQTLNGMEDACAYAVASRDIRRAEEFAEKNHVEKAYGSYAEMLMDDKVDLVYIATPHSHHLEHGKLCISYGKPVLCEKSFTANVKQAKELLAYAKEKNVFITEAIWTRYMPSRKLIADILSSGELGELKGLSANLGYDVVDKERMVKPELAGGALLDVGVYPLNFASMCFGNEIEKITSACVWSPTGVDAQDAMILTYKDGRLATLHAGMLAATEQYGIVYGTKGYMIAYNINNVDRIEIFSSDRKSIRTVEVPKQITGYEYEIRACMRALEAGMLECEEMPHSETLQMMEWMDNIRADWGLRYPFE